MAERPFPIPFGTLVPDPRPRRFLVLPPGFDSTAVPDATCFFPKADAAAAMAAFTAIAHAAPRVETVREGGGQIEFVQRSRVFRFPDYVTVEAMDWTDPAGGESGAALAIYSRAVVGYSDLGVNRKRIESWLAQMPAHPA